MEKQIPRANFSKLKKIVRMVTWEHYQTLRNPVKLDDENRKKFSLN
jgi:hypothetical protein